MSFVLPKNLEMPSILFHGVDLVTDVGDSSKGYHLNVNVMSINPLEEPAFEPVEMINGGIITSQYYIGSWEVICAPFLVDYSETQQCYKDLEYLKYKVMRKPFLFLCPTIYSNLTRSGDTADNTYWYDKPTTRVKVTEINTEPNTSSGELEVSIRLRRTGLI